MDIRNLWIQEEKLICRNTIRYDLCIITLTPEAIN